MPVIFLFLAMASMVAAYNNCPYCSTKAGCRAECHCALGRPGLTWAGCKSAASRGGHQCAVYYARGDHCYYCNQCDNVKYNDVDGVINVPEPEDAEEQAEMLVKQLELLDGLPWLAGLAVVALVLYIARTVMQGASFLCCKKTALRKSVAFHRVGTHSDTDI